MNAASPSMPPLAELQRQFQQHLMHGDVAIANVMVGSEQVPVATRLKVYSDAYRLRLIEALGSNYPRVQQLLGDEAFAQLGIQYVDRHPSNFRSIRWFGGELPRILREMHAAQPWLSDLARFEWAIASAFDAADSPVVDVPALGEVPPDRWSELCFETHPSVQRLAIQSNAPALFKALSADEALPEPGQLEKPQSWMIWRQELTPQYRSLNDAEAAAFDKLAASGSFGEICEVLCDCHDEDQVPLIAAGMLKGWTADGVIARLVLT
jgi:hypothetical protein